MVDHPAGELLSRVTTLEATVRQQGAQLARHRGGRRFGRAARRLPPALLAALLVALVPLATLAANPFGDLNANSPHNGNIDAIYGAGITKGCDPDVAYCPNENVTREEMASFLARAAGLGRNPPVANAKTAVSASTAQTANNALALGGRQPNSFARVARGHSTYENPGQSATEFVVPDAAVYPAFAPMPGAAVTIQAPAAGFILVSADVNLFQTLGERAHIRLRETTSGADPSSVSRVAIEQDNFDQAIDRVGLTWVFPVAGAGAKTFALEVAQYSAGGVNMTFFNDTLTALYVPFGYDGGDTLAP